jgi:hypothetical protein
VKILILGAGPAGLMAAQAATELGCEILIAGVKRKSEMFGAQYLHQQIPGVPSGLPRTIKYELRGTAQGYREKVYGRDFRGRVSPEDLLGEHLGWDIRVTYGALWSTYGPLVQGIYFQDSQHIGTQIETLKPDLTISSLPAPVLCRSSEHGFQAQEVWSIGDAPERGVFCPVPVPEDTIICDGTPDVGWYRAARVFEYSTVEWPKKPPIEDVARVVKPTTTNCDCLPHVVRVGRYGRWKKGVLSHEAYLDTKMVIERRMGWRMGS